MYKLSKTGKMPGKSWSIPATVCKVGSMLSNIENSVCSKCYAKKGSYCYPTVKNLRQHNFDYYNENKETFVADMTALIKAEYLKTNVPYFRWFDSGDLQSTDMLMSIIRIAKNLPDVNFWLPTKELVTLRSTLALLHKQNIKVPSNLTIRLSVFMIDGNYIEFKDHFMESILQTRVINKDTPKVKGEIICNGDCHSCKYACWLSAKNVAYIKH